MCMWVINHLIAFLEGRATLINERDTDDSPASGSTNTFTAALLILQIQLNFIDTAP